MFGLFGKLFKRNKEEKQQIIADDEFEEESQEDALERIRYENRNKVAKGKIENSNKEKIENADDEIILDGMTLIELRKAITKKGNEVLKNLNLDRFVELKSNQTIDKNNVFYVSPEKRKIFEIFKYIVDNSVYDEEIIKDKRQFKEKTLDEVIIKGVYRCLCTGRGVCSCEAASMVYLLDKIGIDSGHIVISPPDHDKSNYHSVVAFEDNKKLMIADITLMRKARQQGIIKNISVYDFCYPIDKYLSKIRQNWYIVTASKKIEIDLPDSNIDERLDS